MLMVECCRSIGLPARFVSGYHLANPAPESYELHAWAEIYLPGAGWRGFDPSAGGETTDRYIVLASSSSPDLTAAITGNFSGLASTQSQLSWTIQATVDSSTNQPEKKTTLIQAA
jgi:transglutaminase-like putative cysteine protease